MPSPFPGMDPYVEMARCWQDLHLRLLAAISTELAREAPDRYVIRAEDRVYVDIVDEGDGFSGKSDVSFITSSEEPVSSPGSVAAAVARAAAPVVLPAKVEREFKEHFLEIRDAEQDRLVTVIEFLSPANKRPGSEGYRLYNRKREAYLLGNVNLVEIDLLRGGNRPPMAKPWPACDCYVMTARAGHWKACEIWPISLRDGLPPIHVPLAGDDADVVIEIQSIVRQAYDDGRYDRSIDYSRPLRPPVDEATAAWIRTLLER